MPTVQKKCQFELALLLTSLFCNIPLLILYFVFNQIVNRQMKKIKQNKKVAFAGIRTPTSAVLWTGDLHCELLLPDDSY